MIGVQAFWKFINWLDDPLVKFDFGVITPLGIIKLILLPIFVVVFARLVRRILRKRLLSHSDDAGMANTVATLVSYAIVVVGIYLIIYDAGIDPTGLALLSGGLGLGIGLGLQEFAKNMVSGLIILINRPLRLGDRVQVGDIEGDVERIGAFSTIVQSVDGASVILPNSQIVQNQLINWTLTNPNRCVTIPVGVSFDSDVEQVRDVLLAVANSNEDVLQDPVPDARLAKFGESRLEFTLIVWTASKSQLPRRLTSDLNFEILKAFREKGIGIPYPQREVNVKNS
ncbi:MAG: mechanosensitive ion channel domain-containing protein [Fimbriimonadaceae bacterium]